MCRERRNLFSSTPAGPPPDAFRAARHPSPEPWFPAPMQFHDVPRVIQQGEALLLAGRDREALSCFEQILTQQPDHPDALNDAALALVGLGDFIAAEAHLERAIEAQPTHESAVLNLIDLYEQIGQPERAAQTFRRYGPNIPASDDKAPYEARYSSSGLESAAPEWEAIAGDGAPVMTVRPPDIRLKVAFVCGPDRQFLEDLEHEIGRGHDVRVVHSDQQIDLAAIQAAMDWADVTWFEWCDRVLVAASRHLRKSSAVVCRIHRYEVFSGMPREVNWSFVDSVVFVSRQIQELLRLSVPEIQNTELHVIQNGVDLDRFAFQERGPGFDLAYVGYLHHRKNPSLLLQCIHALVEADSRYRLHIAGAHQQPEYKLYFDHMIERLGLRDHVLMHGWVRDVQSWLADKHYLVSTSIHESFGYGIAEAMASGIKPVVHHFPGADYIWPVDVLFGTVQDFVEMVRSDSYHSQAYRDFIEEHYGLDRQVQEVDNLLRRVAMTAGAHAGQP